MLAFDDRVTTLYIRQNRHLLGVERVERELRHYRALERVDKTNNVIADLGDFRVDPGVTIRIFDSWQMGTASNERELAISPRVAIALSLAISFFYRSGWLSGFRLIVLENDPDLASSEKAACAIDFLRGQLRAASD